MAFFVFLLAMMIAITLAIMMLCYVIMANVVKNDQGKGFRLLYPSDFSNIMNKFVLPEYGLHLFVTLMLLAFGSWITFIFNLPLLGYHVWRCKKSFTVDEKSLYHLDNTMETLPFYTREGFIKLGFYLVSFFVYLYNVIIT